MQDHVSSPQGAACAAIRPGAGERAANAVSAARKASAACVRSCNALLWAVRHAGEEGAADALHELAVRAAACASDCGARLADAERAVFGGAR